VVVRNELIWLRTGTKGGIFGFHKYVGIATELAASEEEGPILM
jgi:hypothetical protein